MQPLLAVLGCRKHPSHNTQSRQVITTALARQVAFDKVGSMPMARIRGFREENQEVRSNCFIQSYCS